MVQEETKEQTAEELEAIEQQFKNNLEQVFTLARMQLVSTNPNDKKALIDLINFETQAVAKLK